MFETKRSNFICLQQKIFYYVPSMKVLVHSRSAEFVPAYFKLCTQI